MNYICSKSYSMVASAILRDEQHNERVINFTSGLLRIVSNIPNFILALLIFPYYLMMVPVVHVVLSKTIRKVSSVAENIEKDLKEMDYATARQIYDLITKANSSFSVLPDSSSPFTKGVRKKLNTLINLYKSIQKSLETVLFVDVSSQPPLTEQEKSSYDALNDVWGDDEDGLYGEMTFNQLKKD